MGSLIPGWCNDTILAQVKEAASADLCVDTFLHYWSNIILMNECSYAITWVVGRAYDDWECEVAMLSTT